MKKKKTQIVKKGNLEKGVHDKEMKKNTNDFNEAEVQILLNEYNQCNDRIEAFQNKQDNILQITLAVLGGTIAFSILNELPDEFYLIIPLIPVVIFSNTLYHYTRVMANQGYRKYLQTRLNENFLAANNKIRYTDIAKKYLLDTNPFSKLNTGVFIGCQLFSIIFSVVMTNRNIFIFIGNLIIFGIAVYMGVQVKSYTKNLANEVKEFSQGS